MEDRPRFFTPIQVRCSETDVHGYVFFGNYLTYLDVAITEYIKTIGYGLDELFKRGVDLFYTESLCKCTGKACFGEPLHVHAGVSHVGNTTIKFEFAIFVRTTNALVCTGHIEAVVVEKGTRMPVPVPPGFGRAVEEYERRPMRLAEDDILRTL